jgi:hypothetical protein
MRRLVVSDAALSNAIYDSYGRHLPRVAVDAPYGDGVHHLYFFHDERCRFYKTKNLDDCNCDPRVERYVEPVRS